VPWQIASSLIGQQDQAAPLVAAIGNAPNQLTRRECQLAQRHIVHAREHSMHHADQRQGAR
jgi:hypothetical protein